MSLKTALVAGATGLVMTFTSLAQAQKASPTPEPARAFYACAYQLDDKDRTCIPIELKGIIRNPDLELAPASLNKMMTAHLLYKHMEAQGKSLEDPFTSVSRDDAEKGRYGERNGKVAGGGWTLRYNPRHALLSDLPEDHVFTYREVILAMTVYSANDFAVAAARAIAPDHQISTFVAMMNAEGVALGMKNTTFKTPEGMPATGQKTTAEDMTTLAQKLASTYGTSHFDELFGQEKAQIAGRTVPGHLRLLSNPVVIGGKTGTDADGTNVAGYAEKGNFGIAFSTLGSPAGDRGRTRDSFTSKALNAIFSMLGVGDAQAKAAAEPAKPSPAKKPQGKNRPAQKAPAR